MPVKVEFENNENIIKVRLDGNVRQALEAMGIEAVALIQGGMETLYGKPIRDTSTLMGSMDHAVRSNNKVDVGTDIEYGKYVHEGTSRMKGRPFIRDSIIQPTAQDRLRQVAEEALKQGF